jgi:hypothetical protein
MRKPGMGSNLLAMARMKAEHCCARAQRTHPCRQQIHWTKKSALVRRFPKGCFKSLQIEV